MVFVLQLFKLWYPRKDVELGLNFASKIFDLEVFLLVHFIKGGNVFDCKRTNSRTDNNTSRVR